MPDVVLPRLSDSMEEGTIVAWLKSDGEQVATGEPVAEIETDKATTTYEAPYGGVLRIVEPAGATLPVGKVIAVIGEGSGGGATAETRPVAEARGDTAGQHAAEARGDIALQDAARGDGTRQIKASPVARRLARERGVVLEAIAGSGPRGRIVRADVEAATWGAVAPVDGDRRLAGPAGTSPASKGEVEIVHRTRLQEIVARRMAQAKATIPEFILQRDVDMTAAAALRQELVAAAGADAAPPSFNDMVIKACALALRGHPDANAAFQGERVERYSRVNIGFAVAAPQALVVPVVFDADRLSLGQIASVTRAAAGRVRRGAITPAELEGATFTVSNLGMYGVDSVVPIINPPQAAIIGVGAIAERPVACDGAVAARATMTLTLACDHRVLYGADAAALLRTVCEILERPLRLVL